MMQRLAKCNPFRREVKRPLSDASLQMVGHVLMLFIGACLLWAALTIVELFLLLPFAAPKDPGAVELAVTLGLCLAGLVALFEVWKRLPPVRKMNAVLKQEEQDRKSARVSGER